MSGIHADKWEINKGSYSIVPEKTDEDLVSKIRARNLADENAGAWNKSKTMKRIGTIPYSVYFNYALSHGIKNEQIHKWYSENKGKNMVKLLNEFPYFKVGGDIS